MKKRIAVVDYALGNLFSVCQAINYCGAEAIVTDETKIISEADGLVLPGVGAFGAAMEALREKKLDEAILNAVNAGRPFLGICLGMQLLFESSDEFGSSAGLGLIKGHISKFESSTHTKLHVPQVGWNQIEKPACRSWAGTVMDGLEPNTYMYFVHSFFATATNQEDVLSGTSYGNYHYCSAVQKENITATQFHPEKSGTKGLLIYENWIKNL